MRLLFGARRCEGEGDCEDDRDCEGEGDCEDDRDRDRDCDDDLSVLHISLEWVRSRSRSALKELSQNAVRPL